MENPLLDHKMQLTSSSTPDIVSPLQAIRWLKRIRATDMFRLDRLRDKSLPSSWYYLTLISSLANLAH